MLKLTIYETVPWKTWEMAFPGPKKTPRPLSGSRLRRSWDVFNGAYSAKNARYSPVKDHGVFYPRALDDELVFEIKLAPASNVVVGSDPKKLGYELNNINLEYKVIHSKELADEVISNYLNGKIFMYEHVTHHKTISIAKGSDTIINESINVPRRSMRGLLLFYKPYTAGTRDSEISFNQDIDEVKVVVNRIPNMLFSQGIKARDLWEEIFGRFGKKILCQRQIWSIN